MIKVVENSIAKGQSFEACNYDIMGFWAIWNYILGVPLVFCDYECCSVLKNPKDITVVV